METIAGLELGGDTSHGVAQHPSPGMTSHENRHIPFSQMTATLPREVGATGVGDIWSRGESPSHIITRITRIRKKPTSGALRSVSVDRLSAQR